jgi:hypothetical protein
LTFKEIAEQTQQTFGNVRNQYYRSLKRLRAHLSGPFREDRRRSPRIAPPLPAPSVPHSLPRGSVSRSVNIMGHVLSTKALPELLYPLPQVAVSDPSHPHDAPS